MNPNSKKEELRKSVLEKRLALPEDKIHLLSKPIEEKLIRHSLWSACEKIGLYSPVKNEVETKLLFMQALERGFSVYFPRVEQGLRFYEVNEPSDLQKGAWGIPEPKDSCVPLEKPQDLELIVVPGIVFDKKGHRLGYGKGFYDHFLKDFPNQTVGLAYDFQVLEELPADAWDVRLKKIITEKNEY